MLFSIVIPTHNRAALLRESLASVWDQTCTDYEVIVVDDGSVDGTRAYLDELGGRVRAIHQPQQGPGAARNAGIRAASGEYVAFLDSDDRWYPWTLEVMREVIDRARRPVLIIGRTHEFRGDDTPAVQRAPLRYSAFPDFLSSAAVPVATGSGTAVVKRSALADVGGFTERIVNCEDHDLALRLGAHEGFAVVHDPVTVAWRRHAGSLTADLPRALDGARFLVDQEAAGAYPGGAARARRRREIITRHVRPLCVAALWQGHSAAAGRLYQRTFWWHLAAGRLAYLAWFPCAWLVSAARGARWRTA